MIRTFTTLILMMLAQTVSAQCVANAGGNKHICTNLSANTATLGGAPTASGGTASYTYCWSTDPIPFYTGSNIILTASDFLNDTTAANPTVNVNSLLDSSTTFYLKITDALGCVSYDTCKISFTRYMYGLGNVTVYIDQDDIANGDSITINMMTVGGSPFTPYTYTWQPAYGLGTTSVATGFSALPAVSTNYSVTVTDSKGCQSLTYLVYYVKVCPAGTVTGPFGSGQPCVPVGVEENSAAKIRLSVYPNPSSESLTVELPKKNAYTIKLSNALGAICKEFSAAEEQTQLDISQLNTGIYFLQVFDKGSLVAVKKVIRE